MTTLLLCSGTTAQVVSELHYHPLAGDEALEFVEIANDSSTPIDLSGYSFVEGVSYTFPPGTLLKADARIVVSADVEAVRSRYGIENAVGNFDGRLDNAGERVTLVDHAGRVVSTLRYRDDAKWPVGPDGSGHTLTLRNVHQDPRKSENWTSSAQPGGSPGSAEPAGGDDDPLGPHAVAKALRFNELLRGARPGEGWVEFYNRGTETIDLSGLRLTTDASTSEGYKLPPGTTVPGRGFLVITGEAGNLDLSESSVRLFLLGTTDQLVVAAAFDRELPPSLAEGASSECLFPDGERPGWVTATPTPGAPNQVAVVDRLVINEIYYHPPEDRRGEFVELYNRGSEPLDLTGFRFTNGIRYAFPDGLVIPTGGYVVVAEDPSLLAEHYSFEQALGPYSGQLADSGETLRLVDARGNLVDEVRYFDGGRWSLWADGKGASLELADPRQDNDFASAWEASEEIDKTAWEELSFTAEAYVPADETDIHLHLAERGLCLIDDVSVIQVGTEHNYIPNPGFETDTSEWRIRGNHVRSARITSDSHAGQACLELVATGKGDTRFCNQLETDTDPAMLAATYEVSLWARWMRGTSLLFVHSPFTGGPWGGLSSNTLSAALRMTVPWNLGTPGKENSVRKRLREQTGSDNLGPVIDAVRHAPPAPPPDAPVTVHARLQDADGVDTVAVFFREGDANGEFTDLPLADDGVAPDLEAADGTFTGSLPGFPLGTKIVFYVEAVDSRGAMRRFPVDAPARTCLYLVERDIPPTLDFYRIVLDDRRTDELNQRPLRSNELLDGTFVFQNEQVFYNVGVRRRGAGSRARNFRVRFAKDDRFHRGLRDFNIDRKSTTPVVEGIAYLLVGRNGTRRSPAPTSSYHYAGSFFNGQSRGIVAGVQSVDGDYLAEWFGQDAAGEGILLKAVGRSNVSDSCLDQAYDGAGLTYRGEDIENYRQYWVQAIHQTRDRWDEFLDLARHADRAHTSDKDFARTIHNVLDVEEFFRVVIPRLLVGDFDSVFVRGPGHNAYLAYVSSADRWYLLPFDIDKAFERLPDSVFPQHGFTNRLLEVPSLRRLYLRLLGEFIDGHFSRETLDPYLEALAEATRLRINVVQTPITRAGEMVAEVVRPVREVPFRILSGNGSVLVVEEATFPVEGEAPVQVETLLARHNDAAPVRLEVEWLTPTRWHAVFEIPEGISTFDFVGLGSNGESIETASLTVTRTQTSTAHFVRGDVNADGTINIADVVETLAFLFGRTSLACIDAADFDDSGTVNVSDALAELGYLFRGEDAPPPPFPDLGFDPTQDSLQCRP